MELLIQGYSKSDHYKFLFYSFVTCKFSISIKVDEEGLITDIGHIEFIYDGSYRYGEKIRINRPEITLDRSNDNYIISFALGYQSFNISLSYRQSPIFNISSLKDIKYSTDNPYDVGHFVVDRVSLM